MRDTWWRATPMTSSRRPSSTSFARRCRRRRCADTFPREGSMSLRSFTLDDLVRRNAQLHGDRAAFIDDNGTITHAQYAARVSRLAAGLAGLGVGVGDRVAVLAPNSLEFCDLFG